MEILQKKWLSKIQDHVGLVADKFLSPMQMQNIKLRGYSAFKIPMIFYVSPSVEVLNDEMCKIRIPLNFRTKNHLGCMYLGALVTGADLAGGIIAWNLMQQSESKIRLVFEDFQAHFIKKAFSDVEFVCRQGKEIAELVKRAENSSENQRLIVEVGAYLPEQEHLHVADFKLTLVLKNKSA